MRGLTTTWWRAGPASWACEGTALDSMRTSLPGDFEKKAHRDKLRYTPRQLMRLLVFSGILSVVVLLFVSQVMCRWRMACDVSAGRMLLKNRLTQPFAAT